MNETRILREKTGSTREEKPSLIRDRGFKTRVPPVVLDNRGFGGYFTLGFLGKLPFIIMWRFQRLISLQVYGAFGETNLPAEQKKTGEDARVSSPDEDHRRACDYQAPPDQGPQATRCFRLGGVPGLSVPTRRARKWTRASRRSAESARGVSSPLFSERAAGARARISRCISCLSLRGIVRDSASSRRAGWAAPFRGTAPSGFSARRFGASALNSLRG